MKQGLVFLAIALASGGAFSAYARDLSLADAESLLRERSRDLIAARRAVESAGAQREIAAARPNATLSLNSAGVGTSSDIAGPGPMRDQRLDALLRIDQPLERGGKRELRMEAAEGLERAARSDSLEVLRTQLALLRSAYYDLKQAEEKVAILGETAELFGRTLAAAQARLKAGDLAAAEVSKVLVDHERAQNDVRAARADLARAGLALGYLIGEQRDAAALRATDPWPRIESPDPEQIERAIAQLVDTRPDVVAAQARVAASDKLRDLAKSQQTRDITVGAQLYRFPSADPNYSVGFGISMPIFTGNDFSGDIRRAEVERYAAIDALERARIVAGNDIRRAASDLAAAGERLARYDATLVDAAQRTAQAVEFAFQRGANSVLEVLDARRTLRAVQLEALAARADYAKALAAWRASQATAETLGEK